MRTAPTRATDAGPAGRAGAPGVEVTGGVGGAGAATEDLDAAAATLAAVAAELAGMSARAVALAAEVAVEVAAAGAATLAAELAGALTGREAATVPALAAAEACLARAAGPGGAAGEAAALALLAARVRAAVALYRATEAAVTATVDTARDAVMDLVGRCAPLLVLGAATAAASGVDLAGVADRTAFAHPWLVDGAAGGADGFVRGLAALGPGPAAALAAVAVGAGRPWPPSTEEDAVAVLAAAARLTGRLDDAGAVRVTPLPVRQAAGPADLVDLVRLQALAPEGPGAGDPPLVRVLEVRHPGSDAVAWVVVLPGTRVWDPTAGPDPFDLTSDVAAMTGEATRAAAGARKALEAAQRAAGRAGAGDPVMLVGHSQGGILAAALAGDPAVLAGQHVTHLLVSGAPVDRFPVPDGVAVLALENRQDPVPRLDGTPPPDRPGWVTVTRDLAADPDVAGRASRAHAVGEYVETATALRALTGRGGAPAVAAWAAGAAAFLTPGTVTVRDHRIERIQRAAPPAGRGSPPATPQTATPQTATPQTAESGPTRARWQDARA